MDPILILPVLCGIILVAYRRREEKSLGEILTEAYGPRACSNYCNKKYEHPEDYPD